MKLFSAVLLASAVTVLPGRAYASDGRGQLAVTFVTDDALTARGSSGALVDLGSLSASWARGRGQGASAIVVERRVGVRVDGAGRRGFARLRAHLTNPEPGRVVSIDGMVLSAAPKIVDAQAPIGSTVGHVVRVEVPPSQPAGAFATDIVWEVEEP
jgi:hypothetical protein